MPTYDYQCEACGVEFEKFQRMSEEPLKKCPECGKLKVKRLFGTGAGILFKGSGFYETDYRSKNYSEAAKKDKPESAAKKDTSKGSDASKTSKSTKTNPE